MTKTTDKPRLKQQFFDKLRPELVKSLGLKNLNQVPRLEKVVVSAGLGRAKDDKRLLEAAVKTLREITGQQPVEALSRKSIASFKLRDGQVVGLKVTLRRDRMYEFIDRLVNVVLPRVRDFHGLSRSAFDGHGNYNIGLVDQSVFPELSFEDTALPHGLEITLVTSAKDDSQSEVLLESLGLPLAKKDEA
ncbi:MAG TPA: 50S ribosomal protein L5 [Candidatus Saccharimonadales bacterium]